MSRFARLMLVIAAVIEVVFRGIPALFGSPAVARLLNLEYPLQDINYVHAFGAVMICLGILFFVASKAPEKHILVLNIAVLRFALGIGAQLGSYFQLRAGGLVMGVFWWVHMVIDVILVVLLVCARMSLRAPAARTT
jgi:hypothetical protein